MSDGAIVVSVFDALTAALRRAGWLLSGLLLSALSARAEPPPSQEFWNYLVEFGDAQGELFDPADYAAAANLPAPPQPTGSAAAPDMNTTPRAAAPATQEQLP